MSDNGDDLLGDDLGDQSLADYNLGNDEEDQLLADDYENGGPQNVPTTVTPYFEDTAPVTATSFIAPTEYICQPEYPAEYQPPSDTECVVPNIMVEVPNIPVMVPTYAPYEPEVAVVPPAIPAAPIESPQIVPSDIPHVSRRLPSDPPPTRVNHNGVIIQSDEPIPQEIDGDTGRERFRSERPPGLQRAPIIRDIPDTLDKVVLPRGGHGFNPRARPNWQQTHVNRNRVYRRDNRNPQGNFMHRPQFPPPQMRPNMPQHRPNPPMRPDHPQMRSDRPHMRPDHPQMRPDHPQMRPDHPQMRPDHPQMRPDRPQMRPELQHRPEIHLIRPEIPQHRAEIHIIRPGHRPEMIRPEMQARMDLPEIRFRPPMERFPPNYQRFNNPNFGPNVRPMFQYQRPPFRPNMGPNVRPNIGPNVRPNVGPNIGPNVGPNIGPNVRPNMSVRPPMSGANEEFGQKMSREPEVRMLPVLPPNLPPGGLAGKKVLINPHFKGNFQPPVEGGVTYIPTRIQKSPPPPLSPTLENKYGPIKDIDDAAERFIAEQRNALARAANRKPAPRRSPQRYIENTTIEIENDLARGASRKEDDDLLRRQQEFIDANRAGLRRRMRSPSPPAPRRPASPPLPPPPPPDRRDRRPTTPDEETEYRRRLREQENLRDRVLRAKEVRRRRNATVLQQQLADREREKERELQKEREKENPPKTTTDQSKTENTAPNRIKITPDRESSPIREEKITPPLQDVKNVTKVTTPSKIASESKSASESAKSDIKSVKVCKVESPERDLTPPLPAPQEVKKRDKVDSDDDLDLILDDIDDILSDDDESGRFKEKTKKSEAPALKPAVDLRSKLPPKPSNQDKQPKQRIIFNDDDERREKTPPPPVKRSLVPSAGDAASAKKHKSKHEAETATVKPRQRIIFDKKEKVVEKEPEPPQQQKQQESEKPAFSRRVVLQRKVTTQTRTLDKTVFSRIEVTSDPSKPNPGIFSRAVKTALIGDKNRIVVKKIDEPKIEYDSDSEEEKLLNEIDGFTANIVNLPHGMTDTRLKTLAGVDVQTIILDKQERTAKITFKSTTGAETFKRKFNNKMVAASKLTVTII